MVTLTNVLTTWMGVFIRVHLVLKMTPSQFIEMTVIVDNNSTVEIANQEKTWSKFSQEFGGCIDNAQKQHAVRSPGQNSIPENHQSLELNWCDATEKKIKNKYTLDYLQCSTNKSILVLSTDPIYWIFHILFHQIQDCITFITAIMYLN